MNNLARAIFDIMQEVECLPASDQQTKCAMMLSALRERAAKAETVYRVGDAGETPVYCLTEHGARMAADYGPARHRRVVVCLALPDQPEV